MLGASRDTTRSILITVGVILLLLLAWQLTQVLLLAFTAVLVAVGLSSLTSFVERHTSLHRGVSLTIVVLALAGGFGAFIIFIGAELRSQLTLFAAELPRVVETIAAKFGLELEGSEGWQASVAAYTAGFVADTAAAVASALVVLAAGIYLAAEPRKYLDGALMIIPKASRQRCRSILLEIAHDLRKWLVAQLLTMLFIGVMTGAMLYALGVPAALSLALLAALLEFIPYVGAISAAVPALLFALSAGDPWLPVWVVCGYLVIQQIEGNVLTPLMQRWAVRLPPALALFGLLAGGVLFGPLGVVVATPITVALLTIARGLVGEGTRPKPHGERADVPTRSKAPRQQAS